MKILLVDDDLVFCDYFTAIAGGGHTVVVAHNALEASEATLEQNFDLIWLDLFLPAVNGFGLINELSSYADTQNIPIALCSSAPGQLTNINLEHFGVVDCFDKADLTPAKLTKILALYNFSFGEEESELG